MMKKRKLGKALDLTTGRPMKLLIIFAVPIFLSSALQLLYGLIDTKIVGMILGEQALAAVGSASPLQSLLVEFFTGMTTGFGIITAQNFGADKKQELKKSAGASVSLGFLVTAVIVILLAIFLKPVLHALNVPGEQFDRTWLYLIIVLWGMFATAAYNIFSANMRAIGDSVTPLIYLLVSTVLNIFLDIVFIAVLGMDVDGAAWATVLSQAVSAVLCLVHIKKYYPLLWIQAKDLKVTPLRAKKMLQSGLSMGMMMSLVWFGTIALQSAINTLGTAVIVAHTAARKMTEILFLPLNALGSAMATFAGQNLGAGRYDRIRTALKNTLFICWIWDIAAILICVVAARLIIHFISSSSEADVIYWGSTYLRIDTLFYFVTTPIIIIRNTMQGYGDHVTPIISSAVEMAGKMVIAFVMVPIIGYWGIIWAEPIVWFLMLIPLVVMTWKNPITNGRKEQKLKMHNQAE